MQSVDCILFARWIAALEPAGILENHALVIDGGRIRAVLPATEARARYRTDETISRPDHLLIPGLVNADVDLEATLWRAGALADPGGFQGAPADAPADVLADSVALGIIESLLAGITTSATVGRDPLRVAAVASTLGARLVLALGIDAGPSGTAAESDFAQALALHDEFRGHPLIRTAFAVGHAPVADAAFLRRLRVLADQLERPVLVAAAGLDVATLKAAGLWHAGTALMGLGDLAPETVSAGGVALIHRPALNLRTRQPPVPVASLVARGATVALGSGRFPTSRDLLDALRLTARLAGTEAPASTLRPESLLRMATLDGARALGIEDTVGSLAPGKSADVVCLELGTAAAVPVGDPLACVVEIGNAALVSDVWIGGRAMVAEHRVQVADAVDLVTRSAQRRTLAPSTGAAFARQ